MTAGQAFAKKLGVFGCALLLIIYILFLVVCFTSKPKDKEASPGESPLPAESAEFVYENLPEGMLCI